jgi:hypothetical protein
MYRASGLSRRRDTAHRQEYRSASDLLSCAFLNVKYRETGTERNYAGGARLFRKEMKIRSVTTVAGAE